MSCVHDDSPSLSKDRAELSQLAAGQAAPAKSEADAAGAIGDPVRRNQAAFKRFVRGDDPRIQFKDEEGTGADRLMTRRLSVRLERLANKVETEWPGMSLRVTEAWDENDEHGKGSLHYEGRAADVTTSDRDSKKLGRLAGLAVQSGFDWVFYEDASHVHVSVRP